MLEIVRTIAGSHGQMTLYSNGVIQFTADDGLLVDAKVVRKMDAEFSQLAGGPYVNVLDFRPAAFASRDARDLAAQDTEDTARATGLITDSDVGHWLTNNWLKKSKPLRPIGMFEDVDPALAWASAKADELLA